MDCGPACLKALLEGFGIHAAYGRLREACQTDVDGTSIDEVEKAALELGLDAAQVMSPLDHLMDASADNLPAIVIIRQPSGAHHFVVVWRRVGNMVQIMDPGAGRRWTPVRRFLRDVYVHHMPLDAATWREWAQTPGFIKPLQSRMARLGAGGELLDTALSDSSAYSLAKLDAAVRMVESFASLDAIRRGKEAGRLVQTLFTGSVPIPNEYWSAHCDSSRCDTVRLRGAVLVHVTGVRQGAAPPASPELAAALSERPLSLLREMRSIVAKDGPMTPALLLVCLLASSLGVIAEAVLLRGFFDLSLDLTLSGQRMGALLGLTAFGASLLLLDGAMFMAALRLGRRLELRLRTAFLTKIPRLADHYFRSRPASDMAERSHNVHLLRQAPELAVAFTNAVLRMILIVGAIGWLYGSSAIPAALLAGLAIGIPLLAQPSLSERDLRLRSHSGALSKFYLDALLGLTAIRAHQAARAVRYEQQGLLSEWAKTGLGLQRTVTGIEAAQLGGTLLIAVWTVISGLNRGLEPGGILLLLYWVLGLPTLGRAAAAAVWQYPMLRNTALRMMEPLGAPEEPRATSSEGQIEHPVSIEFHDVTARAGGHTILDSVSLKIPAGSHVAIVGASGAGKSSLVGLLLGWSRAATGTIQINGEPLNAALLDRLRRHTAWVDPQVQIWNRSLYQNLLYGSAGQSDMDAVLDGADLTSVIAKLPRGLQTELGEGGALVSGGEGQRVRLARALLRADTRLVILDEPGRGLERATRRALLDRARTRWADATLLAITHDVADTLSFERVLVIENGAIAEDGRPSALASNPSSRFRQLLDAEDSMQHGLWTSSKWRRLRLESGSLRELRKEGVHADLRR